MLHDGQKNTNLQAASRSRGINDVLTNDKDHLKVVLDVRLKLEKDTSLSMPCNNKIDIRGNLRQS